MDKHADSPAKSVFFAKPSWKRSGIVISFRENDINNNTLFAGPYLAFVRTLAYFF